MAQVNPLTREVLLKLVYYGPGLGGKTTSLQSVYAAAPPETRGNIVSLATPVDRTLYFDFMPLRLAPVRGHPVRVQLFTVPGQVYFNATRKLLLTGADGVVFVADSQRDRFDANVESLENLEANLAEQGRELAHMPHVLQLNKRDLKTVTPVVELEGVLNLHGAPVFSTCATSGEGVFDALDALVRLVLDTLESQNVFGAPTPLASAPAFGRAGDAFDEQIGRASEQLWRDTVDRALAAARGSGQAVTGAVREGSLRESRPREVTPREPEPEPAPTPLVSVPLPPSPATAVGAVDAHAPQRIGPTFVSIFGQELDLAAQIERDLAEGRYADSVSGCDAVVSRVLAQTSAAAGLGDSGRDPAFVALMLGLEGPRWLAFRRLVRRAHAGADVTLRDGLEAYATLIDLVVRRDYALA